MEKGGRENQGVDCSCGKSAPVPYNRVLGNGGKHATSGMMQYLVIQPETMLQMLDF